MRFKIINESGYAGYSMSNNAVDAYSNGEMPLSKWTKEDILFNIKKFYPNIYSQAEKLPLSALKDKFLTKSSWHHTSSYYNETSFYSFNEDLDIEDIDLSYVRHSERRPEATDRRLGSIEYLEWEGTRKHPKAVEQVLDDVYIETVGDWYNVYDKNNNLILKKGKYTKGVKVTFK